MESLRQAAIHLIKDNLDLKSLLREVSTYSSGELQASPDDAAINVTMDTLQYWSDTTSQSIPLVASCYALEQLRLLGNYSNDTCEKQHFFTEAQKKEFLALCEFIQSLVQKKFFDRRHFVCGVYNVISSVPVEMYWVLFKSRLITIQDLDYTSDKVSEKFWGWLGDVLGHICAASPSDCVDARRSIVQDISVALVGLAYQEDEYNQYALLAMDCLKGLIFRSHDLKDDCINSYSVITALRQSHLTHSQHLRDILVQVMKEHFSTSTNSTIMTAVEAYSLQELWKFASLSKNIVNFYSEVCEVLDISDCGILLSVVISCDKVAWKNVLEFVSSLINLKANITDELLAKFLKEQVTVSLANCLSHQLQSTLLLARQCSSEGSHLFPSYYNWLQDVMGGGAGDNTTPLTKRSAQFLIKAFTDMIPHETSSYLQVHAKFLRKYLSKYKNSVDHFMTVAMTRLKDLGIGDKEWSEGHELGKALSLSDRDNVEHALKLFEQSKDVPSFVMRMSILQPQKFINLFLPVLLAPRVQPDTPDTREKFIQKLNQLKKIPVSMMSLYETECKRQRSKDLNKSAISLGDNSEITLALQHLMDCVKHNLSGNVSPSLSVLSNAITAACHRHGDSGTLIYSDDQPEQLDLNNPCLYKWQIELVDVIVSTLCSSVMEIYREIEYRDCNPLHRFLWLNNFLEMFSSYAILHQCWFVRLWELLFIQGDDLLESHITGLAVLLAHMTSSQCAYQRLQINRPPVATNSDQKSYHRIKGLAQYGEHLLELKGMAM